MQKPEAKNNTGNMKIRNEAICIVGKKINACLIDR
jgi:hypothetical protein